MSQVRLELESFMQNIKALPSRPSLLPTNYWGTSIYIHLNMVQTVKLFYIMVSNNNQSKKQKLNPVNKAYYTHNV